MEKVYNYPEGFGFEEVEDYLPEEEPLDFSGATFIPGTNFER